MSQDAIVMLKDDHKEVKPLPGVPEALDDARRARSKLVEKIIELLTVHTYIENEVMYPRVRALLPELEDDVLESYEEHHVADVLVMELAAMDRRRAVRGQGDRPHRERHAPHRGGGAGLVPEGPRGPPPHPAPRDREELAAAKAKAPRRPEQPSALKKTIDAVIA